VADGHKNAAEVCALDADLHPQPAVIIYDERKHPGNRWLTRDGVRFLDQALKPTDVGLEFGSGRSSIWFARRMQDRLSLPGSEDEYVAEAIRVADESVDFCLVDGSHRDECAIRVIAKVKRGGLLGRQ